MAMGLYADESETTGIVFTLAGFMTTPGGWDTFCPRWREMLCDTGPYPVDAFHSADIEAARPPFDGWPLEARKALVENALDLLSDKNLCPNLYAVGCTLVLSDLWTISQSLLRTVPEIYDACYRVMLMSVLRRWPAFNGYDFIFDEKKKVKTRVDAHFRQAKSILDRDPKYAGKLNDIVWRDDRKVIPLQAADLLAYEMRRHTWARIERGIVQTRSAYQRIKDTFAVQQERPPYRERLFRCYDRGFFEALAAKIKENPSMTLDGMVELWFYLDAPED